jgi:short chain dehydrogenase
MTTAGLINVIESPPMKTVLITGANKGIGYEVARQFAGKGFHVFIGARNQGAGRKAADEIANLATKLCSFLTFLTFTFVHNTWSHLLWSLSMISRRRRMGGIP